MNKGISFYYGFKENYKDRAKKIKKAGFDCVIANADKKFINQNGSIREQIKSFKKNGLKVSSLHMKYNQSDLPNFFCDNKIGKKLEKNLISDVKVAHKYGFKCVVVHLCGKPSSIGIERLNRVLKVCEKLDVPLAIENIDEREPFIYAFENIKNKYLRFCYDVGHNHCFDPSFDYLEKYGDKLICLHLHDNKGDKDSHTLNKYGNIDWEEIAKKLAKCPDVNLDYELLLVYKGEESEIETLNICYKQACELDTMITKYRNL